MLDFFQSEGFDGVPGLDGRQVVDADLQRVEFQSLKLCLLVLFDSFAHIRETHLVRLIHSIARILGALLISQAQGTCLLTVLFKSADLGDVRL